MCIRDRYQAEGATGPLHSLQSAVEGAMVPLQRASAPLTEAVDDACLLYTSRCV